jgi:hypothetical protein
MLAYPIAALAIFRGVFLLVSVRAFWKRAVSYERLARLPLAGGASGTEVSHD